jgi:hypothetical protein
MFDEGDLVRVQMASYIESGVGLVVDVDPASDGPTYYLISVGGQTPDWYHEDEVFAVRGESSAP